MILTQLVILNYGNEGKITASTTIHQEDRAFTYAQIAQIVW